MKFVVLLAALTLTAGAEQAPLRDLLRDGLYAEEVTRDKETAARQYEQILAQFDEQRPVAVNALFRLAELRRSQNRKDEAITLYQRVLSQFPDADPQANLARTQLSALGAKIPDNGTADDPETQELRRLEKLVLTSPDLVQKPETLIEAAKKGWQRPVDFLLDQRGASDTKGVSLVMTNAALGGHLNLVERMLSRGLDPKGEIAANTLTIACEKGHVAIVKALLAAGASPDGRIGGETPKYSTPLITASRKNHLELAKLLIEKGANVNLIPTHCSPHNDSNSSYYIGSALHEAICFDRPEIIDLLLQHHADVNAVEPRSKTTPLWLAVQRYRDRLPLVKRLLALGANPDVESADKPESLDGDWRTYYGRQSILELSLKRTYIYGLKPEDIETVRVLLEELHTRKATINADTLYRYFDYCRFCQQCPSVEITRMFINYGAPLQYEPKPGFAATLLEYVARITPKHNTADHWPLLELLLKHNCPIDPKWEQNNFLGVSDELKLTLLHRITYPKWAAEKAIHLYASDYFGTIPPLLPVGDAEPPTLERWLLDQESKDLQHLGKNFTEFALYRKTETGVREIAVIRLDSTEPFPKLQWGDILEKRGVISSGGLFTATPYSWDSKVKELLQKRVEAKREPSAPAPR